MKLTKNIGQISLLFWLFIVLAGCQTSDPNFSAFLDRESGFNLPEQVVLPRDPEQITGKSQAEQMVSNAIELGKLKRYGEAERLLREVRSLQYRESEAYRAITNVLAIISLKRGDLEVFKRLGGELDMLLGKPLKVPAKHLAVISLARVMSGSPIPINAPERLRKFQRNYFSNKSNTRKL